MSIAIGTTIDRVAVRQTPAELKGFYARVIAGGGTILDYGALREAVLDYRAISALNPSLYTFASGRKAGTLYSLVPDSGAGDFGVTRSGTTAMELNKDGVWQPVGENVPRFSYAGGEPGILVEEARTNVFLNSDALATQNITVTAAAWTVSFYGTGSITFSGAHTAVLTGTGANDRVSLTFTPSAGALTCTVAGSVLFAQAELGVFSTSYIKTTGATQTRNADVIVKTGAEALIGQTEGTIVVEFNNTLTTYTSGYLIRLFGNADNEIFIRKEAGTTTYTARWRGSSSNIFTKTSLNVINGRNIIAFAWKSGQSVVALNGTLFTDTEVGAFNTTVNTIYLGTLASTSQFNDTVYTIHPYTTRLSDAKLLELTTL
jgi:hypothetical protein